MSIKTDDEQGCFVIAEVGGAHDGDIDLALRYAAACADAGVDVVKYQVHPQDGPRPTFRPDQWEDIASECYARGAEFCVSPFYVEAVDWLDPLVRRWKVASGHVTNLKLLRRLVATGKPVLLSSGMSTCDELLTGGRVLHGAVPLTIMRCVSVYPTPPDLATLCLWSREQYYGPPPPHGTAAPSVIAACPPHVTWGLSDHSGTAAPSVIAAWSGAACVEVHVQLDSTVRPDTLVSLDLAELKALVPAVQYAAAMGRASRAYRLSWAEFVNDERIVAAREKYLVRSE